MRGRFRGTSREVVQSFLAGRRAGTETLQTNGTELWSYGVPVARVEGNKVVMLLDRWWSTTTARHEHLVQSVAKCEGFTVVPVNGTGKG